MIHEACSDALCVALFLSVSIMENEKKILFDASKKMENVFHFVENQRKFISATLREVFADLTLVMTRMDRINVFNESNGARGKL